jgi:glycerophosphoryl diester phosphodiesterase
MFLDQILADMLRALDMEIHVWTVDRLPDAQRLCRLGVDSIMTNRPGWLREKLQLDRDLP